MLGLKNTITKYGKLNKSVEKINALEQSTSKLSDRELQSKTLYFKDLLQNGSSLDDIKEEAFAVVREAAKRVLGYRHYDVQLTGGLVLHNGNIAEMQTGEGKTLVASLPSYLNALTGNGVHVITVNEYLAKRDFEHIGKIHEFLGLTVGINLSSMSSVEKRMAYNADITYGTGNEFGFDYLRDHMVYVPNEKVQRKLSFAIIDEIDSILIDEARTPLIIANKSNLSAELFFITSKIAASFIKNEHFELIPETKEVFLTEKGVSVVERSFGIKNLFDLEHQMLFHFFMQSLRAHTIMIKDVDYIVRKGEIMLVDSFTGRVMEGRSYSDGLQQAIEAKEGLPIKDENVTQATISIQNYFRLYGKLSGMSGTAVTEKKEFSSTYNIDIVEIPTNKPKQRVDLPDLLYLNAKDKYKKIISEIKKQHRNKRPILIGTTSIKQSEYLSSLLHKENIPHHLLNAKSEEQEAKIISLAGQIGQIMIATNMAGRGTDILLGEGVAELGGLHIIGTEKNESIRIDNQLRGRAGRQGDPGSSQFILSLEDDFFTKIEDEMLTKWKKKVDINVEGLIIEPNPYKFISKTQQTIEGILYSAREHLLKIDNVSDQQRRVIYELRNNLLISDNLYVFINKRVEFMLDETMNEFCSEDSIIEEWDTKEIIKQLQFLLADQKVEPLFILNREIEEIKEYVNGLLNNRSKQFQHVIQDPEFNVSLKRMVLHSLDRHWLKHLDEITILKDAMHLKSYAQEDPYRLFEKDAYELFIHFQKEFARDISILFANALTRTINSGSTVEV